MLHQVEFYGKNLTIIMVWTKLTHESHLLSFTKQIMSNQKKLSCSLVDFSPLLEINRLKGSWKPGVSTVLATRLHNSIQLRPWGIIEYRIPELIFSIFFFDQYFLNCWSLSSYHIFAYQKKIKQTLWSPHCQPSCSWLKKKVQKHEHYINIPQDHPPVSSSLFQQKPSRS